MTLYFVWDHVSGVEGKALLVRVLEGVTRALVEGWTQRGAQSAWG